MTGVLPYQAIQQLAREGQLKAMMPFDPGQFQPASFDLRLGATAWRVRASFLTGRGQKVMDRVKQLDGYPIDLEKGAVLERGCVYVCQLEEYLDLKPGVVGLANPKSTTGRLDILTRLITDGGDQFDAVPEGYSGPLYVEIAPRTFSVVARRGVRLNQIRFRRGSASISASELARLHDEGAFIISDGEAARRAAFADRRMVPFSVDLEGGGGPIGWRAKKHTDRIDLERIGHYQAADFWEPILPVSGGLVLDPNDFYILSTLEKVRVPPDFAAEMIAYDTSVGEFRVHYAGFFDPGFGWGAERQGTKAVLEVRSHEVPFVLEHGQIIGFLRYERMDQKPDKVYGQDIKSNYQDQGVKLAKQFQQ